MAKNITTEADFNVRLKGYVKATKMAMSAARALSNFAISHFKDCGDLGPAQRFHDAMVRNYSRQPAFVKWLAAHAPIVMEKGKFLKDKSENAIDFDVEGAAKIAFWEFAPEQVIENYTIDDVLIALTATLKKFEGKKYRAADDDTVVQMEKYKQLLGVAA